MSNRDIFRYCPRCSKAVRLTDSRKIDCLSCGFKLYLNTAAAVVAVIFDADGRLLFIRRNHDPQKGLLDLPGGFVDFNEDGETALRREVLEELGIDLEAVEYCRSIPNTYNYAGVLYHTLDMFFTCRAKNLPSIKPSDEVMEIVYKFPKDVAEDEIAFDSMKKYVCLFKSL